MSQMTVDYVDHMGSDLTVVNAARVSFDKHHSEIGASDEKLIKYLASHGHWTPFSHPQIQLRMTTPLPIRTQCFKHKVGFTENEVSRRYVDDEPEFFNPKPAWRGRGSTSKQGSGEVIKTKFTSLCYDEALKHCLETYQLMLDEGVCPEQARLILPQAMMTSWYWTGSLAAYARFARLRLDSHAQQEIQELAAMVSEIIEPLFPYSWKVLVNETTKE